MKPQYGTEEGRRYGVREMGVAIGRFPPGPHNAITDVGGVRVGHVTNIRDERTPDGETRCIRSGVTAILPARGNIFDKHLVGGGFVPNDVRTPSVTRDDVHRAIGNARRGPVAQGSAAADPGDPA